MKKYNVQFTVSIQQYLNDKWVLLGDIAIERQDLTEAQVNQELQTLETNGLFDDYDLSKPVRIITDRHGAVWVTFANGPVRILVDLTYK